VPTNQASDLGPCGPRQAARPGARASTTRAHGDTALFERYEHIGVSQVQVSRILRHSVARLGTIAEAHG